jgi:type II secretory pathway pseudopilin PulG
VAQPLPTADDEMVTARPFPSSRARRLLVRLLDDRGYSLSELVTVMAIMVTVITALATVFVSGSNAEVDLSNRFQAQSDARVMLDRFRREAHNSCNAASTSSVAVTLYTLSGGACTVPTTWCASGTAQRYAIYRKAGATCDATGTRWADHLVFNTFFTVVAPSAGKLPRVGIDMTIDTKPADTRRRYVLQDAIALRNYLRSAS